MKMRPLTPFREIEEKIYFKNRLAPAPAAQGHVQGPVGLEAIAPGGCDSGGGAFPGNAIRT